MSKRQATRSDCADSHSHHTSTDSKKSSDTMPVSAELLNEMSHDDIEGMSYRPRYHLPEIKGTRYTLPELIKLLDVKLHKPETEIRPVIDADFGFTDATSETAVFTASLDERCMEVTNELKRRNPSHSSRVYAALFAKTIGMPMEAFEEVWVELGTRMGYGFTQQGAQLHQMKTLFDDSRYVSFPKLFNTLKADIAKAVTYVPATSTWVRGNPQDCKTTMEEKT